ncbi:uncharacterized protein LOC130550839 [Triplophysa rosa]|uniref:uncharacterized protein LOC130550839 n=1 Tax=Triplophysa rosa TaxID=992332 RepID=UPI002546265A|nr:uncharacterized protein LOC130550839 [Triplophysa rosa]
MSTITQARAPATRQLYAYKWHLVSSCCAIGVVLSFLQVRLESNLYPSTLKVCVAAIAAHHTLVAGKSLEQHDLVIKFLRGATLRTLLGPFEPQGEASLPHLTMKTVLLVALASIKRVGDLHALSVSNECLEFGPGHSLVVLGPQPGYVPKVPTTPFRDQVVNLQGLPPEEEDPTLPCCVQYAPCFSTRTARRASEALSSCLFVLEDNRRGELSPNRDWRTGSWTPS